MGYPSEKIPQIAEGVAPVGNIGWPADFLIITFWQQNCRQLNRMRKESKWIGEILRIYVVLAVILGMRVGVLCMGIFI